jgi:acetyltransferase-like isoleucine patch superfamily enzyme
VKPSRAFRGVALPVIRLFVLRPAARWRRRRFIMRLHLNAWLVRSTVDVRVAKTAKIGKRIVIEAPSRCHTLVAVGSGSSIGHGVRLRLGGGEINLGDIVDVRDNVVLGVAGGKLVLDGPNNLGHGVTFHCNESIHLAKFAHVAEYSTFSDMSHFYSDPDGWSYENAKSAPIEIGQDVWVCPKATITSGVTIGDHSIVASNTVVIKDAPSASLLSGVPARVVRDVDLPWKT